MDPEKNNGKRGIVAIGVIGILLLAWAFFNKETAPISTPSFVSSSTKQEEGAKNTKGYADIGSASLAAMLANKDFALINVHIPYDGELAKTDAFIPYDAIGQNLDKLPSDKNAKIVLYCRSGSMSVSAAKELVALGYTNVYNLDGGMNEWKKQGNEVLRK